MCKYTFHLYTNVSHSYIPSHSKCDQKVDIMLLIIKPKVVAKKLYQSLPTLSMGVVISRDLALVSPKYAAFVFRAVLCNTVYT